MCEHFILKYLNIKKIYLMSPRQRETWFLPSRPKSILTSKLLHSTQQLGKEETGNFCWSWGIAAFIYGQTVSLTIHSVAPDNVTAKLSSPPLAHLSAHTAFTVTFSLTHSTTHSLRMHTTCTLTYSTWKRDGKLVCNEGFKIHSSLMLINGAQQTCCSTRNISKCTAGRKFHRLLL